MVKLRLLEPMSSNYYFSEADDKASPTIEEEPVIRPPYFTRSHQNVSVTQMQTQAQGQKTQTQKTQTQKTQVQKPKAFKANNKMVKKMSELQKLREEKVLMEKKNETLKSMLSKNDEKWLYSNFNEPNPSFVEDDSGQTIVNTVGKWLKNLFSLGLYNREEIQKLRDDLEKQRNLCHQMSKRTQYWKGKICHFVETGQENWKINDEYYVNLGQNGDLAELQ